MNGDDKKFLKDGQNSDQILHRLSKAKEIISIGEKCGWNYVTTHYYFKFSLICGQQYV